MKKQKKDQKGKQNNNVKEPNFDNKDKCDCKKLKAEIDDLTNSLKRALADYQNLKRRVEEERKNVTFAANLMLLSSVLEVSDDFNLVINKYTKTESDEAEWLSGIKLVKNKFDSLLNAQNVEEIQVKEGDKFDPDFHEAIGTITVQEKHQDGTIIGIARKGYLLGDKVLRPARVMVGKLDKDEKLSE